jgi:hypothetical protein
MEANLNQGLIVRANGGSKSNKMHGGCPARYTRADTDPARTSARTRQQRRGNRHDCPMRVFFVQVSYDCSRSTLAFSHPHQGRWVMCTRIRSAPDSGSLLLFPLASRG